MTRPSTEPGRLDTRAQASRSDEAQSVSRPNIRRGGAIEE